jgi:hypothetical protein
MHTSCMAAAWWRLSACGNRGQEWSIACDLFGSVPPVVFVLLWLQLAARAWLCGLAAAGCLERLQLVAAMWKCCLKACTQS